MKTFRVVWLVSLIVLAVHFLFRLVDQGKLLKYFPLDFANDMSAYITQLFFLKVCGFHQACPYWYNGITTFKFSPPGWYFFTSPLLALFQDPKIAAYTSLITTFLLGFVALWYLGKKFNWSTSKRIGFFLFFFGNAIAIGGFIRLGRFHELLAWVLFLFLFLVLWQYKDKKLDFKFYAASLLYAAIILTYQSTGVLVTVFLLGFILSRKGIAEKGKAVFFGLVGGLISSFWWWPFLRDINTSYISTLAHAEWLLSSSPKDILTLIATVVLPLLMILAFFVYWKEQKKSKTSLLYFIPVLLLGFLFLTRVVIFIPVFNDIFPDPYLHFFMFFLLFFAFSTQGIHLSKLQKSVVMILIALFVIASVSINIFSTPYFKTHDALNEELKTLVAAVPDKQVYMILGDFRNTDSYPLAYYGFGAVYYEKYAVSGWYPEETSTDYILGLDEITRTFEQKECSSFKEHLQNYNVTHVISYQEGCITLQECGLTEELKKEQTCLSSV